MWVSIVMQICWGWIVTFNSPCPPPISADFHTDVIIYRSNLSMNIDCLTTYCLQACVTFQTDAVKCPDSNFFKDYCHINSMYVSAFVIVMVLVTKLLKPHSYFALLLHLSFIPQPTHRLIPAKCPCFCYLLQLHPYHLCIINLSLMLLSMFLDVTSCLEYTQQ